MHNKSFRQITGLCATIARDTRAVALSKLQQDGCSSTSFRTVDCSVCDDNVQIWVATQCIQTVPCSEHLVEFTLASTTGLSHHWIFDGEPSKANSEQIKGFLRSVAKHGFENIRFREREEYVRTVNYLDFEVKSDSLSQAH